jgi:hypothetical protein
MAPDVAHAECHEGLVARQRSRAVEQNCTCGDEEWYERDCDSRGEHPSRRARPVERAGHALPVFGAGSVTELPLCEGTDAAVSPPSADSAAVEPKALCKGRALARSEALNPDCWRVLLTACLRLNS